MFVLPGEETEETLESHQRRREGNAVMGREVIAHDEKHS